MNPQRPIGILDSGIGGLSIFREIAALLPRENLIYLADTAHLPYGEKSPEALREYAKKNLAFFKEHDIKLCVIACHTLSTHFPEDFSSKIPCLTLVKTTLELLENTMPLSQIAILGTTRTLKSQIYQEWIASRYPDVKVFPIACPLLASFIENRSHSLREVQSLATRYLAPFCKLKIDAALLACTHYPFFQHVIQQTLGNEVSLLNPAALFASQIQRWLSARNLLNPGCQPTQHLFFSTKSLSTKIFPYFFLSLDQKQEIMKYT